MCGKKCQRVWKSAEMICPLVVALSFSLIWQGMGCHICVESTVASPAVRRDNVLATKWEYPFRYPLLPFVQVHSRHFSILSYKEQLSLHLLQKLKINWTSRVMYVCICICYKFGHFLKGRSLKGRCNICVYVPACFPVCIPRIPPRPRPYCAAEQQSSPHTRTWPLTLVPASVPASNCTTYPWEELPEKCKFIRHQFFSVCSAS